MNPYFNQFLIEGQDLIINKSTFDSFSRFIVFDKSQNKYIEIIHSQFRELSMLLGL